MRKFILALLMLSFSTLAFGQKAPFLDPKNKDHQLHFIAGEASGEFGSFLNEGLFKWKCDICARVTFAALVGVGKETWDATQSGGKFDLGEATMTTLGGLFSKVTVAIGDWIGLPPATMRMLNVIVPILLMGKATLNL